MLSHFVSDRTIIVGHSLDTDLKVRLVAVHWMVCQSVSFYSLLCTS